MDDPASCTQLFEMNDLTGRHARCRSHSLATRNGAVVGSNDTCIGETQFFYAFSEQPSRRKSLKGQGKELRASFAVHVHCPYLIESGSPQESSHPRCGQTLAGFDLILACVCDIRKDSGN